MNIEKNIPIPATPFGKPGIKAALNKLELNDSFKFPSQKAMSISKIVSEKFHRNGIKRFTVRKISDKDHRVWRLA